MNGHRFSTPEHAPETNPGAVKTWAFLSSVGTCSCRAVAMAVSKLLTGIAARRSRLAIRRSVDELARLDGHVLRDIGLRRDQIAALPWLVTE